MRYKIVVVDITYICLYILCLLQYVLFNLTVILQSIRASIMALLMFVSANGSAEYWDFVRLPRRHRCVDLSKPKLSLVLIQALVLLFGMFLFSAIMSASRVCYRSEHPLPQPFLRKPCSRLVVHISTLSPKSGDLFSFPLIYLYPIW